LLQEQKTLNEDLRAQLEMAKFAIDALQDEQRAQATVMEAKDAELAELRAANTRLRGIVKDKDRVTTAMQKASDSVRGTKTDLDSFRLYDRVRI